MKADCRQTLQNLHHHSATWCATWWATCTATWRPACLQIWPALHLNIALCARTFPCLHAHWRKAWGRKPLQSEAVQCKAKAPPTKADEIFPEFVEISSRQNLHSFPALGKLIILAAARAKGTKKMRQFIKRWWLYWAARKQEKTFFIYVLEVYNIEINFKEWLEDRIN